MDKRGAGITIFRRKFLSLSAENFRRGTLLCFRNFLVSKSVRDKRGGGYQGFRQNCFVSQYRKTSEVNPSVFNKISAIEKFYG